jgi:hypothetical protein
MNKRYVLVYIEYQHPELGDDSYFGWQNFYTTLVFTNKDEAINAFNKAKKDEFKKGVFLAEEIE